MLADNIKKLLQAFHVGEENAITSSVLEKCFSCSGSEIRNSVNLLRQGGEPICSSAKGYFFAADEMELRATVSQLMRRADSINKAVSGLTKSTMLQGGDLRGN